MNSFETTVSVREVTSFKNLVELLKDGWEVKIAIDSDEKLGYCLLMEDGVVRILYADGYLCDYLTAECEDYFYSFEMVAVKKTTTYSKDFDEYADTTAMADYIRSIVG